MEAKDLVLLMLIPIILVSIVIYTGKNPVITGAVTAKQEESNVIGTYSVMPSFKAKIEYDLNDYNKIRNSFDIISNCAQSKDVQSCINDINNNDNLFTWSLGCDKGAEKVLYDFAEFLQACIDSDDGNCLCRKNMDITTEDIKDYLPPTNEYSFIMTENPPLKKIDIELPNFEGLSYSVNTNGLSGWMPKRYSLGYNIAGFLNFNLFFVSELGDKKYSFGPIQQIIIYKNQLNNDIKSIDFVNQKDNNLIYPNERIIVDKDSKPIDVSALNECKPKSKNIYRFCATKKDYKIMAYDKIDGQVKERPLTIEFAAYIPPVINP